MTDYIFTCPLPHCGVVMETQGEDADEAAGVLVEKAKKHLAKIHPAMHKTDKEVDKDIRAHMVKKGN